MVGVLHSGSYEYHQTGQHGEGTPRNSDFIFPGWDLGIYGFNVSRVEDK